MKAIIYTSATGHTERYAKMLSEKTGIPAYPAKEAKSALPRGSEIFYMGWLKAGAVKGLDAAMNRYTVRGAAVVGVSPVPNGELCTEAKINGGFSDDGGRVFYLQGGYAPEKLRGLDRLTMKYTSRAVVRKLLEKPERSPLEETMLDLYQHGGDCVREEPLEEIVRWLAEDHHDGVLKPAVKLDI